MRFYLDESRCHDKKLTGNIKVEFSHDIKIIEVLTGNFGNGNVVDIQLIFFNEMKKQVKGPFESLSPDKAGD
jgi:hypothetical protein